MDKRHESPAPTPQATAEDWLDQLLVLDAAQHTGDYISDQGFTARVMRALPAPDALPAWRRPALGVLWVSAAALLATMLPGTALDVARGAFRLFAAQPFSLSTVGIVIAAIGIATWTGAAVALRRD